MQMLELTPIGWVLIPLGFGLFLFTPQYLYPLTVFFLPFSATAIINVESSGSFSGVQATMFFGALWMARGLPSLWRFPKSSWKQKLRVPNVQLGFFVLIVLGSLIMPVWINGSVSIESPLLTDPGSTPLHLAFRHFTQTVYLLYGVLLTILIGFRNCDIRECVRSVRIFLISAIFVSCWGLFQLSCSWLGIDYPAYIFNTNKSDYAMGYLQELRDIGWKRISSVATEPSIFAACMLIALVFGLFAVTSKHPLISRTWDRLAVCIITLALLLSTSTTAYLGVIMVFLTYVLSLTYFRIFGHKQVVAFSLLIGALGASYVLSMSAQDMFTSIIFEKAGTISGIEAMNGYRLAFQYFLQFPVLGVGWGTVTSRDLVLKLLANTGIVGLLAFSLFLRTTIIRLLRIVRADNRRNPSLRWCSVSLLAASLVLLFVMTTSGFEYVYSQIWFVFGLAIAVPAMSSIPDNLEQQPTGPVSGALA